MKNTIIFILFIIYSTALFADGLVIVEGDQYPQKYLRNKSTSIEVTINGLIAETMVYQEFENESDEEIDGVYSFPLPMNARTTRLMYSYGDSLVDAVLKVKAQTQNPGTGEGGVVALINKYMGKNAIRFKLNNIAPRSIKVVCLKYISTLNHYGQNIAYEYPFDLSDFVTSPLDYVKLRIRVNSSINIQDFDLPNKKDFFINESTDHTLDLSWYKTKVYAADNLKFHYSIAQNKFNLDLYSWKPDTADGYFAMVGYPQNAQDDAGIAHRIMFVLCNSSTMLPAKLEQSKLAITKCLDLLSEDDHFNIVRYNSIFDKWHDDYVAATAFNISEAKSFVDDIQSRYGNRLGATLENLLAEDQDDTELTSYLVFTDGKGAVDPYAIEQINENKTGLFLIAMGNDYDRARLETLASLNYGFVSYIDQEENISEQLVNVFHKLSKPMLKEVEIDIMDPLIHDMYPSKFPAIYGGGDFIVTGRYALPGWAQVEIGGLGESGLQMFPFEVDFSESHENAEFCRNLWAKNAMDHIESRLLIYGETDSLRNKLIDLSLNHNMRCRYTAYTEDSTYTGAPGDKIDDGFDDEVLVSIQPTVIFTEVLSSKIIGIKPVPVNVYSYMTIYIDDADTGRVRYIKIYNLHGHLVKTIDISGLGNGEHDISLGGLMNMVSSNFYFITLEIDGTIMDSKKVLVF